MSEISRGVAAKCHPHNVGRFSLSSQRGLRPQPNYDTRAPGAQKKVARGGARSAAECASPGSVWKKTTSPRRATEHGFSNLVVCNWAKFEYSEMLCLTAPSTMSHCCRPFRATRLRTSLIQGLRTPLRVLHPWLPSSGRSAAVLREKSCAENKKL
jgi:hypothetical protein